MIFFACEDNNHNLSLGYLWKKILFSCQQANVDIKMLSQKQKKVAFDFKCDYVYSSILIGRKQQSLLPWELCHGDRDRVGNLFGFVLPGKFMGLVKNNPLQTS